MWIEIAILLSCYLAIYPARCMVGVGYMYNIIFQIMGFLQYSG